MNWNKYPYTDFHELNLDWILSQIKELEANLTNFVKLNTIKYANPIEWNITSQYETNTVVIDAQTGNAYLSVKPVPAGVAIDNTEYWTLIFNYEERLSQLDAKINTQTQRIDTEISDRTGADAALTEYIDGVNERLTRITDRKFIFISDSYGDSSTGVDTWIQKIERREPFKDNSYGRGFSGQGFQVNGVNGFLNGLQSIADTIPDPLAITDVVVCGGINDANTVSDYNAIVNGITDFCSYCKNTYPNATVRIGFIGNAVFRSTYAQNVTEITYMQSIITYQRACIDNDAIYLNGVENIMHYWTNMGGDNLHPNNIGHEWLARGIADAILTGVCKINFAIDFLAITVGANTVNNITTGNVLYLPYSFMYDNMVYCDLGAITITGDAIEFSSYAYLELGTLETPSHIYGNVHVDIPVNATLIENGSYVPVNATLRINAGKVLLTGNFGAVKTVTSIMVQNVSFSVMSLLN